MSCASSSSDAAWIQLASLSVSVHEALPDGGWKASRLVRVLLEVRGILAHLLGACPEHLLEQVELGVKLLGIHQSIVAHKVLDGAQHMATSLL